MLPVAADGHSTNYLSARMFVLVGWWLKAMFVHSSLFALNERIKIGGKRGSKARSTSSIDQLVKQ
jgi:hypothetical protein